MVYSLIKNMPPKLLYSQYRNLNLWITRNFSASDIFLKKFENTYEEMLKKKRTENYSPQILLVQENNKSSIMTLKEASKLALNNDLKLVKIDDPNRQPKGNRPVYQMMTGKQYYEEILLSKRSKKEEQNNNDIKGKKTILINTKITDSDLQIKLNKISSILEKRNEVKIFITSTSADKKDERMESIPSLIEKAVGEKGEILSKQKLSNGLKLVVEPVLRRPKSEP